MGLATSEEPPKAQKSVNNTLSDSEDDVQDTSEAKSGQNNISHNCQFCKSKFQNQSQLMVHMIGLHKIGFSEEERKDCDRYGLEHVMQQKNLSSQNGTVIQMGTSEGKSGQKNITYNCQICTSNFPDLSQLMVHKIGYHKIVFSEEEHGYCNRYGQVMQQKKPPSPNGKSRQKTGSYDCIICDRNFQDQSQLMVHMIGHHKIEFSEEEQRDCDRYGLEHVMKQKKLTSKNGKSGQKTASYNCKICSSNFQDQSQLMVHMIGSHKVQDTRGVKAAVASKGPIVKLIHPNELKELRDEVKSQGRKLVLMPVNKLESITANNKVDCSEQAETIE